MLATSSASALALPEHARRSLDVLDTYEDIEAREPFKLFGSNNPYKKLDGRGPGVNNPNFLQRIKNKFTSKRSPGPTVDPYVQRAEARQNHDAAFAKQGGYKRRDLEVYEREYDDLLVERAFDDLD